jgi:hypothetical protein
MTGLGKTAVLRGSCVPNTVRQAASLLVWCVFREGKVVPAVRPHDVFL